MRLTFWRAFSRSSNLLLEFSSCEVVELSSFSSCTIFFSRASTSSLAWKRGEAGLERWFYAVTHILQSLLLLLQPLVGVHQLLLKNPVHTVHTMHPILVIISVFRIRIWDLGSGAFLTPGSRIRNRFFPDPGSRIPDPGSQTHIFESLVTIFLGKKFCNFLKIKGLVARCHSFSLY